MARDQFKEWASLGFLRAISHQPSMCQMLSSPAWVDLLFRIIEIRENAAEIPTQSLALRLLSQTLPFSDLTSGKRAEILERLFGLVGHSALMCRIDGSHFGDQGLLQKGRTGRGTRVALTASHSSTIVEESVRLLRTLHSMPSWSTKVNEYIGLKLSLVRQIFLVSCWTCVVI